MDDKSSRRIELGSDTPKKSNTNLWLALGLAVLASFGNYSYLRSGSIIALKVKPGITILAGQRTSRDPGDQFEDVEISGPLEEMKRLVVSRSDYAAFSSIPLAETLNSGELLMQSSFSVNGGRKLSDVIPQDSRAISLQLSRQSSGIASHLKVGNLIDVYDCMGPQTPLNSSPGLDSRILENAKVVAVGGAADVPTESSEPNSVTVLLPSGEVPKKLARLQVGVCISLNPTAHN